MKKIRLYHYSNIKIKDKIRPDFFAENFYTSNDKKISNVKRSFFFTDKNIPEFRFKNTQYLYISEIDKKLLYDLKQDKNGYTKKYSNISELLEYLKLKYKGVIYNLGYDVAILFYPIKYIIKNEGR